MASSVAPRRLRTRGCEKKNKWHACPGSYNKNLARREEGNKGGEGEEDERGVMGEG